MMIKHVYRLALAMLFSVLLFGCEQQSLLTIYAKPTSGAKEQHGVQYIAVGVPTIFNVKAESLDSEIAQIEIFCYDEIHGRQRIFDTIFTAQCKVNFDWEYTFPYYKDSTYAEISFIATAKNAEKMGYKIPCVITPTEKYDFDNVELVDIYSAASQKCSAFSFTLLTPIFKDTVDHCMYDREQSDSSCVDKLSRSWGVSGGILFARVGNFDYANASFSSIQAAYDYSSHHTHITDIQVGDIFIVGVQEKAFGLIKVVLITDEEGTENDRYTFSAKFISRLTP